MNENSEQSKERPKMGPDVFIVVHRLMEIQWTECRWCLTGLPKINIYQEIGFCSEKCLKEHMAHVQETISENV